MVDNVRLSHVSSLNVSPLHILLVGVTAAPMATTTHSQSSCSDTSWSNQPSSGSWTRLRSKNYLISTFHPSQVMDYNGIFKG